MPSLQLDIEAALTPTQKQALARKMSDTFSRVMGSDPRLMTIAIRTVEPGSLWHCGGEDPVPASLLMCDVRAGRDRETRHALAKELSELIVAETGVSEQDLKVEFTQHTGDEMYHPFLGGFNRDWDASERSE